jgi:hypothetical protein
MLQPYFLLQIITGLLSIYLPKLGPPKLKFHLGFISNPKGNWKVSSAKFSLILPDSGMILKTLLLLCRRL